MVNDFGLSTRIETKTEVDPLEQSFRFEGSHAQLGAKLSAARLGSGSLLNLAINADPVSAPFTGGNRPLGQIGYLPPVSPEGDRIRQVSHVINMDSIYFRQAPENYGETPLLAAG